ncbi:MAG: GldG family protein, partial [Treponema sp.]|nr:GldG family protein [Treponema sp.]
MTRKQTSVTTVLTLVIIALCLLVSRQVWFRVDITRDRLNTVSAVSRNLHTEIRDTVQITYFISDRLRGISPIPGEIEDFLREYVGFSRGRMRLTVRDPARADMTRAIEQLGILPQQIQTFDQGELSIVTVYSGIVIEYLDEVSVMPVVFSLETLEYDMTSRIRAMVRGTPRIVGIIVGDPNPRRWEESYRHLHGTFIQAGYQVRFFNPGEYIPDTISALMVLDGVEVLDDPALFQIDRYIQAGGRALFTVRAVEVDIFGTMDARLRHDRGLLEMLASYGVMVHPEIVMDQTPLSMPIQVRSPGGFLMTQLVRNFQWIRLLPENGNPSHPATSMFAGLDLFWANPISVAPPEGVVGEYLFTTTGEAWTMREPFLTNPDFAALMERDAHLTAGRRVLGASLSGVFPSWFGGPGGRGVPEHWASELPPMPEQPRPARIIVIGESEFATALINVTG